MLRYPNQSEEIVQAGQFLRFYFLKREAIFV